ncbi:hypothetical protein FEI13_18715 [Halomonas urmiana]|uniref:Uncharacterized protein n=2 Tax=Halomonas urmiana TaxID=490901 RepID=A0A5R8M7M0_9GAMM|nr:hypothetical protein FEI13_18715 [Halomonas urmiana]
MEFLKGAKDLARNPLGIVALFISLIYGFASLLLDSSVEKLSAAERWPLILFIVFFPIMVLVAFYKLVTKHHGKLYAPADYKDDKSFLRTLSPEEQEVRLEKEVKESFAQLKGGQSGNAVEIPKQKESGRNDQIERQKRKEEHRRFREELEKIEANVIESIAEEYNSKAEKNVGIGETDANFDAFLTSTADRFTFVEVKVLRSAGPAMMMLDRILYNAVVADKFFNSRFKLVLAVVYYFEDAELERVERFWRKKVSSCPANIELRFIPRSKLEDA